MDQKSRTAAADFSIPFLDIAGRAPRAEPHDEERRFFSV
jgi:hypothetical protein